MTAIPSYSTGTVTVATDGTVVTGTTTLWGTGNIKPGDLFQSGHFCTFITDVTDDTHISVLPWGGAALSGAAYAIWKVSAQRMAGSDVWDDVDKIVASLNDAGYMVFVRSTLTAPDPSLGNEGQYAFQPATGAYWQMTGGVWVPSGGPVKGYGGTSTTSRTIGIASQVFATQSNLAYDGARVRASVGTDPTKWMEGVATYAGTTLTIAVDRTNGAGTFATWKFAISGQPGAGDLTSTNNLSDLPNKPAAIKNLGLPALLKGFRNGLQATVASTSNNKTITIAAGAAVDSTGTDFIALAAPFTKSTAGAWAPGSGSNGLDNFTGSAPIAGQSLHWFLIKNPTTADVDVSISANYGGPSPMPSGFTLFKRIFSTRNNDADNNLIPFFQRGNEFTFYTPILSVNAANPGTAAVSRTLHVPLGTAFTAMISGRNLPSASAAIATILTDLDAFDVAPSDFNGIAQWTGNQSISPVNSTRIKTSVNGQIRTRQSSSGAGDTLTIYTRGYLDDFS